MADTGRGNGYIVVNMISSCGSKVDYYHLVELENYAANTPDIARLAPAQLQDDLGRPVVSGGHNTAMVLPVEGGGAEVNELHSGVPHPSDVPLVRGAVLAVPVVADKQNVLGLQVGVSQMILVEKLEIDLELKSIQNYIAILNERYGLGRIPSECVVYNYN